MIFFVLFINFINIFLSLYIQFNYLVVIRKFLYIIN